MKGHLVTAAVFAYGVYNYAYYMLGAALNQHFIIYVATFLVSAAGLISVMAPANFAERVAALVLPRWRRSIGSYLLFVATGLSAIWVATWGAYAFAGKPTPVEPEAFRLVAALDLTLMVPVLALAGVLLLRGKPWGIAVGVITAVQSALYLLVLSVNSVIAIKLGLVEAPGELVIWLPLVLGTTIAACALVFGVSTTPTEDR